MIPIKLTNGTVEIGFSFESLQILKKLHYQLEQYVELDSDAKIINDINWEEIRQLALELIKFWKRDELELKLKG